MQRLIAKIEQNKFGQRILREPLFRLLVTTSLSLGWNLAYALFNGILGLIYHSWWFLSMFAYFLILGVLRLYVIRSRRSTSNVFARKTVRICGIGMIVLAVTLSGIICMGIAENHHPSYPAPIMITIATYTFYLAILSVVSAIKTRKKNDNTERMLRDISLAGATGAMLSLERMMLGTFGNASDTFSFVMEAASGAVAFLFIALMGALLLIKRLK